MTIFQQHMQSRLAYSGVLLASALLLSSAASAEPSFGPQSSQKNVEWGFDFVEEFDGLQTWRPNYGGYVFDGYRMPKLSNGSNSPWVFYTGSQSSHTWIGGDADRPVWRGDKSLSIDLGTTGRGPSRLGIYFGGTGYTDFSLFYMVWIPKNMFPTSCEGGCAGGGGLGTYDGSRPYTYFASWKFNTFNIGCNGTQCPVNNTYGIHHAIPQFSQYNYTPNGLTMVYANSSELDRAIDAGVTLNDRLGDWFGVEFRIRNISSSQYRVNIWWYNKQGNAVHAMRDATFSIPSNAQGLPWDYFVFGGNNANSWSWGPTMQSHYYVDDFIIDNGAKGQIGPRYFSKIGAKQEMAPPSPPPSASGTQQF